MIPEQHDTIRLLAFLGVLLALCALEQCFPRRLSGRFRGRRWLANYVLLLCDVLLLRVLIPLTLIDVAASTASLRWGLFNHVPLPLWAHVLLVVVVMDLLIYLQHVLFHRIPLLWRIHQVHHCDTDVDSSTGIRFHPLEIGLSLLLKMVAVILLGANPLAVLCYEVLLNTASLFTHSNLALPAQADGILRRVLVTPDMHRIHHSVYRYETDSNYGNILSCWDRLFGTWRTRPADGQRAMRLGLPHSRDARSRRIGTLLLMPFRTGRD